MIQKVAGLDAIRWNGLDRNVMNLPMAVLPYRNHPSLTEGLCSGSLAVLQPDVVCAAREEAGSAPVQVKPASQVSHYASKTLHTTQCANYLINQAERNGQLRSKKLLQH